jgi:uncharacterized protein YdhG (YjbR/CyaY superfamily)
MPATKKPTNRNALDDTSGQWTDDELEAMKDHAKELKAAKRRGAQDADGEADLLAKLAEMSGDDRAMGEWIHGIVKANAPELSSKTWYGMPAYTRDGKVVCHYQPAAKFKTRYATLGFSEEARLDDGTMWPVAWAVTSMSAADGAKIAELLKRAVG